MHRVTCGEICAGGISLGVLPRWLAPITFAILAVTFPFQPFSLDLGLAAGPTLHPVTRIGMLNTGTTTTPVGSTTSVPGQATPTTGPVPEPSPPRHYVVLIVIDASRPQDFSLAGLPHIRDLMRRGVVYDRAWVGEMQSSTPNVHVTFGTGTLPRENGFLGFGWAAPDTRKTLDFRTLVANREIDPVLKALPMPSVATRLHQVMPRSVSVAVSGHKDYAVVGLGGGTADYELYGKFLPKRFVPAFMHAPPPLTKAERQSLSILRPLSAGAEDSWAFHYAADVALHVRPRLLMMNLPEIDTYGHWNGPANRAIYAQLMRNIDRGIGTLEQAYRRLGLLSKTDFIITADHSMMESHAARNWHVLWDAAAAVHASVARADGEGGAVWLQNPTQAKAVATQLVAMRPAHVQAIFYRSAPGNDYTYVQASPMGWLVNRQVATALQYLVSTTAGQNGPDLWVLYRENYTVVPRNVQGTWKGTHGGPTWKVQHVPLIMAGPSIRRGAHSQFAARAIDIAPTMERLLGIPGIQRDGVLLADALTDAAVWEKKPQSLVAPSLAADVAALQAQSKWDTHAHHARWPTLSHGVWRCGVGTTGATPSRGGCVIKPRAATNS